MPQTWSVFKPPKTADERPLPSASSDRDDVFDSRARAATAEAIAVYWPGLRGIWPAYRRLFEASSERSLFVPDPPEGA